MKSSTLTFGAFVLIAGAFITSMSVFTVNQWEQALVLRFGEPVRTENAWPAEQDAGLKFKMPFMDNVVVFDRRNLELDMEPEEILASDQERLLVDAFVRYRVTDVRQFYETLRDRARGEGQMKRIMDSTLRDVLGRVDSNEIISGQRAGLMDEIEAIGNRKAKEDNWGLEIIDVRIRTADLPQQNAERVFNRMRTDRERESAEKKAQGVKQAITIKAQTDKTVIVTLANAREQSEIIKGDGDGQRNKIYADAYNLDADFYEFYGTMESYRLGLRKGTNIVTSPDNDFLSYLSNQHGSD